VDNAQSAHLWRLWSPARLQGISKRQHGHCAAGCAKRDAAHGASAAAGQPANDIDPQVSHMACTHPWERQLVLLLMRTLRMRLSSQGSKGRKQGQRAAHPRVAQVTMSWSPSKKSSRLECAAPPGASRGSGPCKVLQS
jgi:hypothetical protein